MNTTNNFNRREFLQKTAAGAAAVGLSSPAMNLLAADTPNKANNKVGLYSITFLGVWYRGDALSLDEMMIKARDFGYDGIEIDGKRPHGNPLDMPRARCKELKLKADDLGLDIYAVSGNNDFSSPVPEYRECQIVYLRELMRMTSDLGVKPLRVFLGWPGVTLHPTGGRYDIARESWQQAHYQFEPEQIWDWCREGLIESAKYAEDFGVTLALQNHKPVIHDWHDMMRMINEVDSPSLKACLDAPILEDKSAGRGSGVGLSTVYGFVTRSGGSIELDSIPGSGTTVRMRFPVVRGVQPLRREPVARTDLPTGAERILVVEDDEAVRKLASRTLQALGYAVREARSGDEAMGLLDEEPATDCLFTDLQMPGNLSGNDLVLEVRRRFPEMPIIVTSGYSERHEYKALSKVAFVAKPYSTAQLARLVRQGLDADPTLGLPTS